MVEKLEEPHSKAATIENETRTSEQQDTKRRKKGGIDSSLSDEPFNDSNLEEISHPSAKEHGHFKFRDKHTGEIINYDKGKQGEQGHEVHDHYHRLNPNSEGKIDKYLDSKGNPVPKGSEDSHLYPPKWVWWK